MKKTPNYKLRYDGTMNYVPTTLSNLLRMKKGSTCLYQTSNQQSLSRTAASITSRGDGKVVVIPLFAVDLVKNKIIKLCRVIVLKRSLPPEINLASKINFCAPPPILARCKVGTSCLYESMNHSGISGAIVTSSARFSVQTLHLIDIHRGTSNTILRVQVVKQGTPYERPRPDLEFYRNFIAD